MDLSTALFVVGTLALVAYLTLSAYLGARILRHASLGESLLLNPAEAVARFAFIAVCVLLGWLSGLPPTQLGWRVDGLAQEVLWGFGVGALLAAVNHWSTRWAVEHFGPEIYPPAFLRALLPRSRDQWPAVALALLPAALAEEFLFRGLAIGGLSAFAPPLLLAISFAGLFGLAHLPQGRLGVVGASGLGLALSLLFLWRWSVVACTVAHYVVNLTQLTRAEDDLRWLEDLRDRRSPE